MRKSPELFIVKPNPQAPPDPNNGYGQGFMLVRPQRFEIAKMLGSIQGPVAEQRRNFLLHMFLFEMSGDLGELLKATVDLSRIQEQV